MYPTRIRLSTSALELYHTCERKFQLIELLQNDYWEREDSAIFAFGRAWGEGIVEYLLTGDLDASVYRLWQNYWPILEDTDKNRTQAHCIQGLKIAKDKLDLIRKDWRIASFNGKPARELAFHLDINEKFYFQSAIDAVLQNVHNGYYAVLENKHTMSWLDDITPMYKNSIQGLLYSIVLDRIAAQPINEYGLNYLVGQFKSSSPFTPTIHWFPWRKTLLDRLNCFVSLGMDVKRIQECVDINIFPMRGHSCLRYNKPCSFFGTCQLRSNDTPKTDAYLAKTQSDHVKEIESNIQFRFTLDELVADHLRRVETEELRLEEIK